MDEQVAKLVGLIEHAELVQRTAVDARRTLDAGAEKVAASAEAARRSMADAAASIDVRIAQAVQQALEAKLKTLPADLKASLVESLTEPSESLRKGSRSLSYAIDRLGWRQAAFAASIAFAMILGCVLVWWWLVPSSTEMQQLRDEHAQLVADNGRLSNGGALSRCDGQLCVRIDKSRGAYGHDSDYFIVKGQ